MIKEKIHSNRIYLIAGESSGDILGAKLIDGIRILNPNVNFSGIAGPQMIERGIESLFPMSDLSVMGITEVLPRLWLLMGRIKETITHIRQLRPDVVVTIDSPDFSFRVAKGLSNTDIPLVHYVAPSVWAWRPKRAKKIAKIYNQLLTLFPFEPPYFEKEGLPTTFVGHPLVKYDLKNGNAERFRRIHGIETDTRVLCLLPGSRHSEVSRLLPIFIETLNLLRQTWPDLHGSFPTINDMEGILKDMLTGINNISIITEHDQKADAYAAASAAVAASGTVTLELAMARVPSVVGYIVNPITAALAKRLLHINNIALVNILLNQIVIPEYLQERCTPNNLVNELKSLLSEGDSCNAQLSAYKKIEDILTLPESTPNETAARAVLRFLPRQDI